MPFVNHEIWQSIWSSQQSFFCRTKTSYLENLRAFVWSQEKSIVLKTIFLEKHTFSVQFHGKILFEVYFANDLKMNFSKKCCGIFSLSLKNENLRY